MANDPAFLFYSSDFLSGVTDLTMEERGQYITLLCIQHQKGHLSDKTIRLSVGSISVDVLNKFEKDQQGNFFNTRLMQEIQKRVEFTESRRLNGSKGGRPKANAKPSGKPNANLPENRNENEIRIEDKDKKESFEKKFEIAFDELILENMKMNFPKLDLKAELTHFMLKCNSAKSEYHTRDPDGLRLGFLTQLKNSKSFKPNGTIKNTPSAEIIPKRKEFKRTF